jgi:hypothetical protein
MSYKRIGKSRHVLRSVTEVVVSRHSRPELSVGW